MIIYKEATISEIETFWNNEIQKEPSEPYYKKWKDIFINENKTGFRRTYFIFDDNKYIGQGTLILSEKSLNYKNSKYKMAGNGKAELNKLEILKEYEGKGIIGGLFRFMLKYAIQLKLKALTIGVEATETRNMQIYFHWGFTNFICHKKITYPTSNNNEKNNIVDVLYYQKIL